jgi:hypothetical protein
MEATLTASPPLAGGGGLGAEEPEVSRIPLSERTLNNTGVTGKLGFTNQWTSYMVSLPIVMHELKSRSIKMIFTINNGNQILIPSGRHNIMANTSALALPPDLQRGKVELAVYLALLGPSKDLQKPRGLVRIMARGEIYRMGDFDRTMVLMHGIVGLPSGECIGKHRFLMVTQFVRAPTSGSAATNDQPPTAPTASEYLSSINLITSNSLSVANTVPVQDIEAMRNLSISSSSMLWQILNQANANFSEWLGSPFLADECCMAISDRRASGLKGTPIFQPSTEEVLAVLPKPPAQPRRRARSLTPTVQPDDGSKKLKGEGGRGRSNSGAGAGSADLSITPSDGPAGGGGGGGGGSGSGSGRSAMQQAQLLERQLAQHQAQLEATRAELGEAQRARNQQYEATLQHEREVQRQQQQSNQQHNQMMQQQGLQQMQQMIGATLLQSAMHSDNQQAFSALAPGLMGMMGGAAGTASSQPPGGPSLMSTSLLDQQLPHQAPQLQPQLQQQLQQAPQPPPPQPPQQQLAILGASPAPVAAAAAAAAADGEGPDLTVDQLNTQITTLATQLAHLGPNHAAAPIYQATLVQRQQQHQTKLNQQF